MADVFQKWKDALNRTSKATLGRLATVFGASEIKIETWDELEELLIQADIGVSTTLDIIATLIQRVDSEGITRTDELQALLREELIKRLDPPPKIDFSDLQPAVILIVGVNGSGKTTSIAKLGKRYLDEGKTVMFGAADTFRAAAVDQLQVWATRLNVPIVAGQPDADPGAVAYDSVQSAISRGVDILFIDTAGRLQTRTNLMEELKKVYRVTNKSLIGSPHATWLVLDSTTGQNALSQAKAFKEAVNVTGVILAKLDSSARGGMALAIQKELGLPILFAGLGEKMEDLQPFDRVAYVDGILGTKK